MQKAKSQLEVAKESRCRIVAVVGLFDKGKTWLTNKVFGVNLPSGKLCTNKGACLGSKRDTCWCWILLKFSPQYPIVRKLWMQFTMARHRKSLMFEMISRVAHHMVFVVNDLTWFEQSTWPCFTKGAFNASSTRS